MNAISRALRARLRKQEPDTAGSSTPEGIDEVFDAIARAVDKIPQRVLDRHSRETGEALMLCIRLDKIFRRLGQLDEEIKEYGDKAVSDEFGLSVLLGLKSAHAVFRELGDASSIPPEDLREELRRDEEKTE